MNTYTMSKPVVWKFPIPGNADQTSVPGVPLHVELDPTGALCVWSLVDGDDPGPDETHAAILIRSTGHPLPAGDWRHLNSFITGAYVFHAFTDGWDR